MPRFPQFIRIQPTPQDRRPERAAPIHGVSGPADNAVDARCALAEATGVRRDVGLALRDAAFACAQPLRIQQGSGAQPNLTVSGVGEIEIVVANGGRVRVDPSSTIKRWRGDEA
jgi:hypothetical protein